MASIIDDFTPIYNAIVNPVVQKKKLACTDTTEDGENNYNCEEVYNVNSDDIQQMLDDETITETEKNTYRQKIRNSAEYFKTNYISIERDNSSFTTNMAGLKLNDNLQIVNKIKALRKTRDDYETMYALMQAMQVLFMLYLGYVFFNKPFGYILSRNETNSNDNKQTPPKKENTNPKETREVFLKCLGAIH